MKEVVLVAKQCLCNRPAVLDTKTSGIAALLPYSISLIGVSVPLPLLLLLFRRHEFIPTALNWTKVCRPTCFCDQLDFFYRPNNGRVYFFDAPSQVAKRALWVQPTTASRTGVGVDAPSQVAKRALWVQPTTASRTGGVGVDAPSQVAKRALWVQPTTASRTGVGVDAPSQVAKRALGVKRG
jgi:Tfp pilus assembly protein PilZ